MVDARAWKQVKDEARESPARSLGSNPLEEVAEALRSHPRGSQRVLEVYSLLALNLVREPTSLSSYPRGAITVSSWLVVRVNIVKTFPS
jgi:hypothetical protein